MEGTARNGKEEMRRANAILAKEAPQAPRVSSPGQAADVNVRYELGLRGGKLDFRVAQWETLASRSSSTCGEGYFIHADEDSAHVFLRHRPDCAHSDDFRSVRWKGRDYLLPGDAAAVVRLLWPAWENGTPEVSWPHVQEALNIKGRPTDVFRRVAGWHNLVTQGASKGTVRLNE